MAALLGALKTVGRSNEGLISQLLCKLLLKSPAGETEVSAHTYFAYNCDALSRANVSKTVWQGVTQPALLSLLFFGFSSGFLIFLLPAEHAFPKFN